MSFDRSPSTAGDDVTALAQAAIALTGARESGDPDDLEVALALNRRLWDRIQAQARSPAPPDPTKAPDGTRDDLLQVCAYMTHATRSAPEDLDADDIAAMIDINVDIALGLLARRARARWPNYPPRPVRVPNKPL
ncbi:flagellar biosynthesis regulator FlaF [Roseospira marina]|nr:flagellar biosynthesis regulator FlaF [Roseospira marina]MBB4314016.1 putative membrane protein YccC [Roseospira marina]MBB5087178.1 putative membrane protein YccC [Roseospira marina]